MNSGILLDTHTLIWLFEGDVLRPDAMRRFHEAQIAGALFVSPVTAWEAAVAQTKRNLQGRPLLGGLPADQWFKSCVSRFRLKIAPIDASVALEAARVPTQYGSGDPGDCFLIATARIFSLTLMTRDGRILALSMRTPAFLSTLAC